MKTRHFLAILVLSLFGSFGSSTAGEPQPLKLELYSDSTALRIILRNDSMLHVKANCRFAFASEFDPAEIWLRVLDKNQQVQVYQLKTNVGLPEPSDWCDLSPSKIVGLYLPVSEVQYAFELPPGAYTVQAFYVMRDKNRKELSTIGSNAVEIRIKH